MLREGNEAVKVSTDQVVRQFGIRETRLVTEPSAVAPDARVNWINLKLTSASDATALGSVLASDLPNRPITTNQGWFRFVVPVRFSPFVPRLQTELIGHRILQSRAFPVIVFK